jgi:hypothetical protein
MVPSSTLEQLHGAGVSIWLDTLSRQLLDSGEFGTLIRDYRVTGAELEREGVRSFCDSYHQLLGCIERKVGALV